MGVLQVHLQCPRPESSDAKYLDEREDLFLLRKR